LHGQVESEPLQLRAFLLSSHDIRTNVGDLRTKSFGFIFVFIFEVVDVLKVMLDLGPAPAQFFELFFTFLVNFLYFTQPVSQAIGTAEREREKDKKGRQSKK